GLADMPLVGTGVHGEPVGSRAEAEPRNIRDARPRQVTAVADVGDSVEIDGEIGHGRHLARPRRRTKIMSSTACCCSPAPAHCLPAPQPLLTPPTTPRPRAAPRRRER